MTLAKTDKSGLSRRALLGAFAATTLTAAPTFSNAAGFLRGAGDIRRIRMFSGRTGERIDMVYWIDGKYIKDAVKEINYFMRDWRSDDVKEIDLRTIDIMAASHNLLDVNEPYMMLSGYRSPKTNAMLRSRSRGVAKNSPAHARSGGRSAALFALCHPDGERCNRVPRWWCWQIPPVQFRPHGLRRGPQLERLKHRRFPHPRRTRMHRRCGFFLVR